jgi:hypothetical protein
MARSADRPHLDVLVHVRKAAERRAAGASKRRVLCPVVFGHGIAGPARRRGPALGQLVCCSALSSAPLAHDARGGLRVVGRGASAASQKAAGRLR